MIKVEIEVGVVEGRHRLPFERDKGISLYAIRPYPFSGVHNMTCISRRMYEPFF